LTALLATAAWMRVALSPTPPRTPHPNTQPPRSPPPANRAILTLGS